MKQFVCSLIACLVAWSVQADERFLPHITWITENSPMEYNGEPLPRVEYVSQGILQVMAYGDQAVAQAEHQGRQLPKVLATYDEYMIYVVDDMTFTEQPWVLVHELVHYLQDVNGTTQACVPANEPQAYKLHAEWQRQHGYEVNQANIFYGLTLALACFDRPPIR